MKDIKTKDNKPHIIKTLNKEIILTEKTKDSMAEIEKKANDSQQQENNINEYGSEKIKKSSEIMGIKGREVFNKLGKKSLFKTRVNLQKANIKLKNIISKKSQKKASKALTKTSKKAIKTSKEVAKKTEKAVKETMKASQRAAKLAKEAAIQTAKGIKVTIKATISAIKAIIAGTKALISAIMAGGWVAVVVIIIICLVGLLVGSIFGIFFSNEDTGTGITTNNVVAQINVELEWKISLIKATNIYDDYVINSNRADWKNVLAIYTVKVTKGVNETDVITFDEVKVNALKQVFWDMHEISSYVQEEEVEEYDAEKEEYKKVKKKILHIEINNKSVDDMVDYYNFSQVQQNQLEELLSSQYEKLWTPTIYGSIGDSVMVQIALEQLGNIGGEKYWRWYGFEERVEWCAIFVSWVANEAGYINNNTFPKFSNVKQGIEWFKVAGQWENSGYIPKSGDIIFFDWEQDGKANHVGIVERVENNSIYTIEGNSINDECRQQIYSINDDVIYGFGTPLY